MKKVLVIQTAFLGDVVLATAFIEKLHQSFPGISVSMLVREGNEGLFKNHPFLAEVLVWKKKSGKWNNLLKLLRGVRKMKYDAVFNLQRFFSSGILTAFSKAPVRAGFQKNPMSFMFTHVAQHTIGDNRHEISRNMQLLAGFCDMEPVKPKLYPSETDFTNTSVYRNDNYITMAPASVWFTKQLPENKWVQMIQHAGPALTVYLLGASADAGLCDRIAMASGNTNVHNLAGKLNLLETSALMLEAKMNYVNDSAPLHMASAMNAPVTAFFCSTIPAFGFGPLSDQSFVVETTEKLTCRPCGLHGYKSCPEQHFKCATTIEVPKPVRL